jgi:hypothetical protein
MWDLGRGSAILDKLEGSRMWDLGRRDVGLIKKAENINEIIEETAIS